MVSKQTPREQFKSLLLNFRNSIVKSVSAFNPTSENDELLEKAVAAQVKLTRFVEQYLPDEANAVE